MMEFKFSKMIRDGRSEIIINDKVIGEFWHNGNSYQCQITGLGLEYTEAFSASLNACGNSPIDVIGSAIEKGYKDLIIIRNALETLSAEIPENTE